MSISVDMAKLLEKKEHIDDVMKYLLDLNDKGMVIRTFRLPDSLTIMFNDGSILICNFVKNGSLELEVMSAITVLKIIRFYAPYDEIQVSATKH